MKGVKHAYLNITYIHHLQNIELNSNRISEEPLAENSEKPSETGNQPEPKKKKRKKKKKAKRNQTAPSDEGENNETGIVLKPIAWKTPPASLNGFPGNGRKLEPIRPPLHNSKSRASSLYIRHIEFDQE